MYATLFTLCRSYKMLGCISCAKWAVVYYSRDVKEVKDFVKAVIIAANRMGFLLSGPREFVVSVHLWMVLFE